MQICLDKLGKFTFLKGKLLNSKNITLDINTEITKLKTQ